MTPTNFQDLLQQKLLERTNYNRDLIEEKNNLQSEMSSLPAMLRASGELSAIRNPLERESIYSQRVNNIGSRLGTVTDLLGQRGQNFSGILNSANSAYGDYLNEQQARRSGGGGGAGGGISPTMLDFLYGQDGGQGQPVMGDNPARTPIQAPRVDGMDSGNGFITGKWMAPKWMEKFADVVTLGQADRMYNSSKAFRKNGLKGLWKAETTDRWNNFKNLLGR